MDGYHFDDMVLVPGGLRQRKGAPETFHAAGFAHMIGRLRGNAEPEIAVPVFDRSIEIASVGFQHELIHHAVSRLPAVRVNLSYVSRLSEPRRGSARSRNTVQIEAKINSQSQSDEEGNLCLPAARGICCQDSALRLRRDLTCNHRHPAFTLNSGLLNYDRSSDLYPSVEWVVHER